MAVRTSNILAARGIFVYQSLTIAFADSYSRRRCHQNGTLAPIFVWSRR
jgi:hypothetical protein